MFSNPGESSFAKLLAVCSYHFDLSLRRTSQIVYFLERASHESVRKWYRRLGRRLPPPQRRRRSIIVIDEIRLKIC
jgi:transposase-like protein